MKATFLSAASATRMTSWAGSYSIASGDRPTATRFTTLSPGTSTTATVPSEFEVKTTFGSLLSAMALMPIRPVTLPTSLRAWTSTTSRAATLLWER